MKKITYIILSILILSLFISCATFQSKDQEDQGEWKASKLFVQYPIMTDDGRAIKVWRHWQLEYNTKTNLLRPMMPSRQKEQIPPMQKETVK